jgi:hypothetical protein
MLAKSEQELGHLPSVWRYLHIPHTVRWLRGPCRSSPRLWKEVIMALELVGPDYGRL